MADLDTLVENYFAPKEKKIKLSSIQSLMEIIKETHEEFMLEREVRSTTASNLDKSEQKSIDIKFPKIRISEDFGKIGTGDRAIIEKFAKNIGGSTVEEKIANLNSILTEANPDASIGQLLSTMVITEILSSIVSDFTESAGGFIFEGFLAGLFGGKSVQIVSPDDIEGMDATGKPITDVILGDKHYSLKLLGKETAVAGSFRNMVNHFKSNGPPIVYLDARRIGKDQGLEFGEFTITLENFLDVFVTPFLKEVTRSDVETIEKPSDFKKKLAQLVKEKKPVKKIKVSGPVPGFGRVNVFDYSQAVPDKLNEERYTGSDMNKIINMFINMPDDQLQSLAPFALRYAEQKFEGTKAEKLFGNFSLVEEIKAAIEKEDREEIFRLLELTPGYDKSQQFEFTRKQAEDIEKFKSIGKLMIGPDYMKKAFANYANVLRDTLTPVYDNLQLFTDNINDYFLGVGGEDAEQNRKQYAMNAIKNANDLETSTNRAVEKIEKKG